MTENKQLLDQVKCEIRSVLLTVPNGFELQKFCKEYRGIIGRPIPYQQLGYGNLEELLNDLPDVLQFRWNHNISSYVLKAVADQSTKHIEKMVSKQKVSKQTKMAVPRFSRGHAPPPMYFRQQSVPPRTKSAHSTTDNARQRLSKSAPPIVPANIKSEIILLMNDYPDGVRFKGFLQAYSKKYGKELCYEKMGFMTLHTCLEQVSGVRCVEVNNELQVCLSGDFQQRQANFFRTKKTAPIYIPPRLANQKLQSHQALNSQDQCIVSNKNVAPQHQNLKFTDGERFTGSRSSSISNVAQQHQNLKLTEGEKFTGSSSSKSSAANTSKINTLDDLEKDFRTETTNQSHSIQAISGDSLSSLDRLESNFTDTGSSISDKMKNNFIAILKHHPHGIWSSEFPDKYQEHVGYSLDLSSLGYYSLIEMVDQHPEIFSRYRPPDCKSDWKLFSADVDISKLPAVTPSSPIAGDKVVVLDDIVANMRTILQLWPEGIFLDDIMHVYNLNFKTPLIVSEFGFEDLENFLLNISKSVPLKIKYSNVRKVVCFGYEPTVYQAKSPVSRALYLETPNDAILPGVFYERQKLPQDMSEFIPVYIGTISNPSLLWIQLKGGETSGSLGKLMDTIDDFYNSPHGNAYIMHERHITIGAVCAGIWCKDHSWHRISIIAAATDQNFVEAEFVDYGTKEKVLKKDLRFLKSEFFKLPAQAIRARMGNLKPINGRSWDPRARDRILELCKDKPLMAEIKFQPFNPGVPSVYFCDTSQEYDVFIHEVLIKEGLAAFDKFDSGIEQESVFSPQFYSDLITAQGVPSSGQIPVPAPPPGINVSGLQKAQLLSQLKAASTVMQNDLFLEDMKSLLNLNDGSPNLRSLTLTDIIRKLMTCTDPVTRQALLTAVDKLSTSAEMHHGGYQQPILNNCFPQYQKVHSMSAMQGQSMSRPDMNFNMSISAPKERLKDDVSENLSEEFEDDDDEQFEKFCAEKTRSFVKKVKLHDGYKIHIIAVDKRPFVSCGDISHLFWKNQTWDHLYRRLRSKSIMISSETISSISHPQIFHQLRSFNVIGIKEENENLEIMLYPLDNVIDILNIFGHPSKTIRDELKRECYDFYCSCEDSWEKLGSEDSDDDSKFHDTDNDKFHRLCIYDLESVVKALKYKRDRLMKELEKGKNIEDTVEEIRKVEGQMKMYENRIKEIKALSMSGR